MASRATNEIAKEILGISFSPILGSFIAQKESFMSRTTPKVLDTLGCRKARKLVLGVIKHPFC
jgi:spore coat polysaccharide biosynthesis predicted glycosyltransferase SpsG